MARRWRLGGVVAGVALLSTACQPDGEPSCFEDREGGGCVSAGKVWCSADCTCHDGCLSGEVFDQATCRCVPQCEPPREMCGGGCLDPCPAGTVRSADCRAGDIGCVTGIHPVVTGVVPPDRAEIDNVPAPLVSATFDMDMRAEKFQAGTTVKVTNLVTYTTTYDAATKKLLIASTAGFDEYTTYRITIVGGEDGVQGTNGVSMQADFVWRFYTKLKRAVDSLVLPRTGLVWWTFAGGGSLAEPMTSASHSLFGVVGQPSPVVVPTAGSPGACSVSLNYTCCAGFIWHLEAER